MPETILLTDVVECPTCDTAVSPSATVCGECGERLVPPLLAVSHITRGPRCTCSGAGICGVCVIAIYDEGVAL